MMDEEPVSTWVPSVKTSFLDVLSSAPSSHSVSQKATLWKPVPPLVVAGPGVDGRSPSEHVLKEEILNTRALQPLGSNEGVDEMMEGRLRLGTSEEFTELPAACGKGPCKDIPLGQRKGSVSSYGAHSRFRHLASKRKSFASSVRQLSGFAALLFILTFYLRKCLNTGGRFSGLFSGLSSLHYGTQDRENERPPYLGGLTPIRRLAGEGLPRRPPHREGRGRGTRPVDEALCSAIEASTAPDNRVAAGRTVEEESDEEAQPGPSPTSASSKDSSGSSESSVEEDGPTNLREHAPGHFRDGFSQLVLSNSVALGVDRIFITNSRVPTANERKLWVASLEEEEQERLESLNASISALQGHNEKAPTSCEVNSLLVSALQGHLTLMRLSRIFPERASNKCLNLSRASSHGPTMALASVLHRGWSVLGMTDRTVAVLLQHALRTVGSSTWQRRRELYLGLLRGPRSQKSAEVHAAFVAEGSVLRAAFQAWNPLAHIRMWAERGHLPLDAEDKQGLVGCFVAREGDPAPEKTTTPRETGGPADGVNGLSSRNPTQPPSRSFRPEGLHSADEREGSLHLLLSNTVAREIERNDLTRSRAATTAEREQWISTLEWEELDRLSSLLSSIHAFAKEERPARRHIEALLVAALQGQSTLMRMSRVFPDASFRRCLSVPAALRHSITLTLAKELRLCWKTLGVEDSTLQRVLEQSLTSIGAWTSRARAELFVNLTPRLRRGVDPKAHAALAAEGAVMKTAIQEWDPLWHIRLWVRRGILSLDKLGVLQQYLSQDSLSSSSSEPERFPGPPIFRLVSRESREVVQAPLGDEGHPWPSTEESDHIRGLLPTASEPSNVTPKTFAAPVDTSLRKGTEDDRPSVESFTAEDCLGDCSRTRATPSPQVTDQLTATGGSPPPFIVSSEPKLEEFFVDGLSAVSEARERLRKRRSKLLPDSDSAVERTVPSEAAAVPSPGVPKLVPQSQDREGPRRKKQKAWPGAGDGDSVGEPLAATPELAAPALVRQGRLKRALRVRGATPRGRSRKKSDLSPEAGRADQRTDFSGAKPSPSRAAPDTPTVLKTPFLQQADSRRGISKDSQGDEERSGRQTASELQSSAVGSEKGPQGAGGEEEELRSRQAPRRWGLLGLTPDSAVPVSRIISEFIDRHFPAMSSNPPLSSAAEP
ncbi:hypothetical protein CSUI_002190 [Cystoisospora suis]|uniref:Uncharacterized protein n=1 Tax=Cystoisospora suis TaxID=483139 RepID=A0A2C6L7F9_9APIC|nr:hypothetical protein CSUI_002190 [Cystoisospora suis]